VRIASFPSASATLLTMAVSDFVDRHPKVRLSVTEAEPPDSMPRLRAGDIDLALTFDYPAVPGQEERDIERTHLLTESMHVALPKGHELAARSKVRMSDLRDEVWLSGDSPSSCGEMVVRACRDAGFDPRVGFESDDYHVLQGFVAAGLGVTLLPDLALPTLRGDIAVLPTDPPAPMRRVWAETRRTRSAATGAMLGVLVEAGERFGKQYAKLVAVA
jgi:DNA-binding transcriptional LysR family regulator